MSSTDVFVAIVFYVVAITMVVGAVGMVLNRDMIRSAMLLVLVLSGVAVMYTKAVEMRGNRFEDNRGAAAYGLSGCSAVGKTW